MTFDVRQSSTKRRGLRNLNQVTSACTPQKINNFISYPEVCCFSPLCQQDFEIHPLQDARRCRDRSYPEEDSTASLTPPAVMVPATVFVVTSEHLQITNDIKNVVVILLRGAATTSVHSSWPSVEQELGLCHVQP